VATSSKGEQPKENRAAASGPEETAKPRPSRTRIAGSASGSSSLANLVGRTTLSDLVRVRGIENLSRGLLPRYDWVDRLVSRTLVDVGAVKALENLRVLPRGLEIPAFGLSTEVARALSGPSTLSALVAAQEAHKRILALTESPAWLNFVKHHAELMETIAKQFAFTQVSDTLQRSIGSFAQVRPPWEIERPVSIGVQAWDEVLRRSSDEPDEPEIARVYATGRASVGIVSSGLALVGEEEESSETREFLGRDPLGEQLRETLGSLHRELPGRLDGAWERIRHPGPDAASQAAHSLMELIDWALRLGAPDAEVLVWHARQGRGTEELHEGKPTRSLRAKYILRDRSVDARVARMYLRSLSELTEIIQSQKHGLGSDDVDTVAPLVPTVEGLLVFLFISGR
jgi:hypothetical protein